MIEAEWKRFESTGSIKDYLSYRGHTDGVYGDATSSMIEREGRSRSVTEHGADHSADGHGVISSPGGRI